MTTATHSAGIAKHVLWIALGLGSVLTAVVILSSQIKQQKLPRVQPAKTAEAPVTTRVTLEKIGTTANLGNFSKEVPAINLGKRTISTVTSGDHEPEYRGSKFVEENKAKWTLQVMQVRDEDLIRTYLAKRDDRALFNYLRLSDGKNPEQFVLLYGVHKDAQSATRQLPADNFGLPSSIKIIPQKISSYRAKVNDLGTDETNAATVLHSVVLKKVAIPKPKPITAPSGSYSANSNRSSTVQLSNLTPQQLEQIGGDGTIVRPRVDRPRNTPTHNNETAQPPSHRSTEESQPAVVTPRHDTHDSPTYTPTESKTSNEPKSPDSQVVDPF